MSTKYESGRAFENYVRRKLEKEGWWVCRSAGSKGRADLVAIGKRNYWRIGGAGGDAVVRLIQCKSGKKPIADAEKQELIDLARELNVTAAVAFKDKSGRVVITVVE